MYNDLFKPNYLQTLCRECGLNPSKKYGQNYLITDAPVNKMIKAARINKEDTIIEIGPGFGILTLALTKKAGKVIAFEIEKKLENYWVENKTENLEIIYGNVLNKIQDTTNKIQNYKVVANLPYQITSNILRTLLELENPPESMTVMVQKEVADRICTQPGEMSILSVSVQYFGEPKIITKVPRGCFWPSPKVDSAVLHIEIKKSKNEGVKKTDTYLFFKVVRAGFANKRKQLWRNLSDLLGIDREKLKNKIKAVTGNELIRAQELNIEQWKDLTASIKLDIVNS